jgi:hypothetical protein
MSRTYKDRLPRKYRKGYCWLADSFLAGTQRKRIEKEDCPSGGSYKKLLEKYDPYAGM